MARLRVLWIKSKERFFTANALALFAGALTPFAFAPFNFFPLAFIGPALLFLTWHGASRAQAAWRGFLFGFGLFGVGVSWVYVSLHTFGNMPPVLAGIAVVLFAGGLALFPALAGWLQGHFARLGGALHLALFVPGAWVFVEWLRGWVLTGFPWLNLGYSQTDTPIANLAPWLGVYGMSFAVALTAGLLAVAWRERGRVAVVCLPLIVVVWLASWLAGQVTFVQPTGMPVRVALVQANVPLSIKWRPEYRQAIVDRYVRMSEQAPRADIVVWPEAAVPGYFHVVAPQLEPQLKRLSSERNSDFLIGAVEADARGRVYYNSVFAVGRSSGSYRKQHLVPFGEFLPWPGFFGWLLDYLQIPMSNFSTGDDGQALLTAGGQVLGVSVCYEDAFGEEIVKALPRATLLVNVSEDAWFGNSLAPHQRLQMARVRAREAGRSMLRAANTGPSAIIDHRGEVIVRSPQFVPHVINASAQPMVGLTPYARYGNVPVITFLLALFALGAFRTSRYKVLAKSA